MVNFETRLNTKTGEVFNVILGDAPEGTEASYHGLYQGIGGNDGYRKSGDEYQYRGGTVQNWSNDKNERYASFTDAKTGAQTMFPGASITNFGVLENTGATTGNGSIHADNTFGLADLQHEYGHYLQALAYGSVTFYSVIFTASFYNAATSTSQEHANFWTEKDANAWSTLFFGKNSEIGQSTYYPKEFSNLIIKK